MERILGKRVLIRLCSLVRGSLDKGAAGDYVPYIRLSV